MIKGRFILYSDAEAYRTGVVVECNDNVALVRFDDMRGNGLVLPMELISTNEMACAVVGDIKAWNFFDSREDLKAYVDWLDSPDKPAVVRLVPKK